MNERADVSMVEPEPEGDVIVRTAEDGALFQKVPDGTWRDSYRKINYTWEQIVKFESPVTIYRPQS